VCLDIDDVVRDELTILEKKIEENLDIVNAKAFLSVIDGSANRRLSAAISGHR
jgi:hypothetical protein